MADRADHRRREREAGQSRWRHAAVSGIDQRQRADDREAAEGRGGCQRAAAERRDAADAGVAQRQCGAIKVLLDHKADVNAKEKLRGTTALMWAAEQTHPAAVKLLLEHGADVKAASDPDTRNSRLNLAPTVQAELELRARRRRLSAQWHRRAGGRRTPGAAGELPEQAAAAQRRRRPWRTRRSGVRQLPMSQPALNDETAPADDFAFFRRPAPKDGGGLTPLVFAAREGCFECAKDLVEAGADVNQTTHYGWTPLLTATQNRHYKLAA